MQRLLRIHSHIRGLFWTSKLFLLASTCRPPLITQLPVCTCHLSECVYVWVYIIVIQYQLCHSNVIMSKKRNICSHVAAQSCLDKRSRIRQIVSTVLVLNPINSYGYASFYRPATSTYQLIQLRHLVTMTSHKTFHCGHLAITVILRGPEGDRYGQVLLYNIFTEVCIIYIIHI